MDAQMGVWWLGRDGLWRVRVDPVHTEVDPPLTRSEFLSQSAQSPKPEFTEYSPPNLPDSVKSDGDSGWTL